jgi:hypothetical protein
MIKVISKTITPEKMLYNNEAYRILSLPKDYIISTYNLFLTDNQKLQKVLINAYHPNANPDTCEFCLPEYLKDKKLNDKDISLLETSFRTYYMNNCYFTVWNLVEWELIP